MKHQMVITSNGTNRTEVVVDGIDLSDVITEIRFAHVGGKLPVLEMAVANCDIKIKSPQIPRLPEVLQNFYKLSD